MSDCLRRWWLSDRDAAVGQSVEPSLSRSEASKNAKLMRELQLIPKLLLTLRDVSLSQPTIAAISNVLSFLLQGFPSSNDLLRYRKPCVCLHVY